MITSTSEDDSNLGSKTDAPPKKAFSTAPEKKSKPASSGEGNDSAEDYTVDEEKGEESYKVILLVL